MVLNNRIVYAVFNIVEKNIQHGYVYIVYKMCTFAVVLIWYKISN